MSETIIQTGKHCSKCGQWKLLSEFFRDRARKDGFKHRCKECATADTVAYREKHPEKVNEVNRRYREKHGEERRQYARRYAEANKQRHLAQERPRPAVDPDLMTEQQRRELGI